MVTDQDPTETIKQQARRSVFQQSTEFFFRMSRSALDFLIPQRCCLCGKSDEACFVAGVSYCDECASTLSPDPINRCERCGAEAGPFASTKNGCTHCRNRKLKFRSVTCLAMYDGKLRKALLSAKWSFSAVPMRSLARLLVASRSYELEELRIDRVIPIPQHWRQRLVRNFNPAIVIAEEVGRRLGVPCDVHILRRSRRTRPQKRVSVQQRFENQKGTLTIRDPHLVKKERILLIDDVLTTGATCSEAAALLRSAGAADCHVAVLGRVLDHSA